MTPAPYRQRVIPLPAWITAGAAYVVLLLFFMTVPRVKHDARIMLMALAPLASAGYILLIGYVYGDARRRGMRYVMWTLLATVLFYGIGIILYFILREPMLGYCSRCGSPAQQGFAFCPHCGAGLQPACPGCHRVIEGRWSHCAWCGTPVASVGQASWPANAPKTP